MPIGTEDPSINDDALNLAAPAMPTRWGDATATRGAAAMVDSTAAHWATDRYRDIYKSGQPDEILGPLFGAMPAQLSTEETNARFGIPGVLRFDKPTYEDDAAYRQHKVLQQAFVEQMSNDANLSPLTRIGADLYGGLFNPTNLALAVGSDGLGVAEGAGAAAVDALGLNTAARASVNLSRMSRVANRIPGALVEGSVAQVPFVAAQAASANYLQEDFTVPDALSGIAQGAIFHTLGRTLFPKREPGLRPPSPRLADVMENGGLAEPGLETPAGEAPSAPPFGGPPLSAPLGETPIRAPTLREAFAFKPDPVPESGVPDMVADMGPDARTAGFLISADQVTDGRQVDVGDAVYRESHPPAPALDEARDVQSGMQSFRPLDDAQAVTTRGREIPVRFGLVEMADLVTSHDDNLGVNPAYPAELQPRARERAGAQARNLQLEKEMNPKLLMRDVSAAGGSPIVAPDGVVESGNGRTIALRRSAARGTPAYEAYLAELKRQGFNTEGMRQPVLVRMRTEPMLGAERVAMARELNADVTERMGPVQQAMADAADLDPATMAAMTDAGAAGRRGLSRAFLQKIAPDQIDSLVDRRGQVTQAGRARIDAALAAKAYGDPRLVEALFETADPNIKTIGAALKEAAPAWAAMRAEIEKGAVAPDMDMTAALRSAVEFVRSARDRGLSVSEEILDSLGRKDLFGEELVSAQTEWVLRTFFKDEDFSKPESAANIAGVLGEYAKRAEAVPPGEDMFGNAADAATSLDIYRNSIDAWVRREPIETPSAPGREKAPVGGAIHDPVLAFEGDGGAGGQREGSRLPAGDGGSAGGNGAGDAGGAQPAGGAQDRVNAPAATAGGELAGLNVRESGMELLIRDEALRSEAEDTARLAAQNGESLSMERKDDPNTIANAVHAAAMCLGEALEG